MKTRKKLTGMQTRRELLKKGAYAAPAILTLAAVPAFADHGSGQPKTAAVVKTQDTEKASTKMA